MAGRLSDKRVIVTDPTEYNGADIVALFREEGAEVFAESWDMAKPEMADEIVAAKTHGEGLGMLDEGKISAYFGDRSILLFLIKDSKAPGKLRLADDYLSVEPYALALPRGDDDFRLAVDRALSHIYRSGEIVSVFQRTFGGKAEPSQILRTLYVISSLPD